VVDNSAYGTIRMHQEREFPGEERISATRLANPDFAALAEAFGGWSARAGTTEEFKHALVEAQGRGGVRLIHCTIDIEQLAASGASISGLRGG
jgi:acetolactate synthase-1/2/3 large subunit